LAIAFFVLFFASWVLHAMGGAKAFNEEQFQHGEAAISVWRYVTTSQFWFESMQNWQSEFIAVAAIVGLSIFLRQRGSAPSGWPNRTDTPVRKQCAGLARNQDQCQPVAARSGSRASAAQGRKCLREEPRHVHRRITNLEPFSMSGASDEVSAESAELGRDPHGRWPI